MSPNLTPIDIARHITDIVETWRTRIEMNGVTLTCFIDDKIKDNYLIDTKGFHTCLNTLISNAAHYTNNGRVHVHVTAEDKPHQKHTNFSIIIADTGKGLSHDQQISFLTGNTQTRLVDAMRTAIELGGKITFNSSLGRGSEFIFNYPCRISNITALETNASLAFLEHYNSDDFVDIDIDYDDIPIDEPKTAYLPEEKISREERLNPDNLRGLRVLIVDDIPSNQDVIKIFLNPEGCACFCSPVGAEALEVLKTQMVDVILMDIRMPGMNGIDTIRTIRNSDLAAKNVPIIALTADHSAENNAACLAVGAELFLTKPVLCRDLLEAIRFVRRYAGQEEAPRFEVA